MADRRWIILCVLFLARSAMGFQFQSIASVGPLLSESLLINYAQVGTLIGMYFLPGALVSLPGSVVIQRFGDKAICATGLGLMVAGGVLLGASHDFGTALAARLISGTGAILFNQVLTKMATDWFAGREIVFAMAVVLASWPFGIAAGLIVQPLIAGQLGWPLVMYGSACLCALALILVALAYRSPLPGGSNPRTEGPAPAPAFVLPPRRQILPLTVAGIIWGNANVGLVLFFSFAPGLLREFGFSPVASASLPSTALWIIMVSVPLGGYLIERSGKADAAIVTTCALTGIVLLLLAFDLSPLLSCVLFGVVMGLPAGAVLALPAGILAPENRAAGFGVFFTCYYALMALGPAVAGWLRDHWGSARAAMVFAALLFLAIAPLLLLFQRLVRARRPVGVPEDARAEES